MVEGIKSTDRIVVDLKMKQVDYNEAKKEAVRAKFAEKYNVPLKNVRVNFCPITVNEKGDKISLASDIINNVHLPEFQVELERQWLENSDYTDIDFEKIKAIDREVNSFIDFDAYSKYKQYKFKYVKWDNFLSYGKDNYFDFTKLNGIVLLNGSPENQCGKTTFAIDLLRFALFGKCDKAPVLDRAFNAYLPKETTAMVEACIEIDGIDYVIRRTLERPSLSKRTAKSKIKQNVEYYKLINGQYESMENCEAESNTATTNVIKEAVGTVDDFDLVISATSKTLSNLLEMGQADKGRLFSKWLGLLTIEEKNEQAKKIWSAKSKSLWSNIYNKETLNGEITNLNTCIDCNNTTLNEKKNIENEVVKNINKLETDRDATYAKRKPIDNSIAGLDVNTIDQGIKAANDEIIQKQNIANTLSDEINATSGIVFSKDDYDAILNNINLTNGEVIALEGANGELRGRIKSLRDDNKRIEALMSSNVCPTCGHEIDIMEQAEFINKNNAEEKKLVDDGLSNKVRIEALNTAIVNYRNQISIMEENKNIINERQKKILKLEAVNSGINALHLTIEKLNSQKVEIEKNRDNVMYNNEIDIALNNIAVTISNEKTVLDNIKNDIAHLKSENDYYKSEIGKRNEIIGKLLEEEEDIKHWNVYLEMVGKNGISKIVLRNALPILNNEISRLLDGICDFEAIIEMDDKNNVCINLYKDGVTMDLGTCSSGFEGTVTSLALRSALGNISTMSKPNMLVLDEVLAGIAASNYDKVHELYNRIAANYGFIINITHNELISDWHNQNITIKKDGNVSTIVFNEH